MLLEGNDDMKFNIHGSHIEVTEPIKNYIEEKIGKLSKYFDNSEELTANVVIRTSGIYQIIEVTIPIKKAILRGEERNKDLYAAIDVVSEKMERQIRKNKTRSQKKKVNNINMFVEFELTEEEKEEKTIVKRKEIETKPMSEEEAILQMNLLGHDFFVFKDSETNQHAVVYKRKDENYGIIEIKG